MRTQGKLRGLPVVAACVLAFALPAAAQAAFPGANGRIAYDFQSLAAAKYHHDVREVRSFRLGRRPFGDRLVYSCVLPPSSRSSLYCSGAGDPAYAPDGRRLAFVQRGYRASRRRLPEPLGPLAIVNDDGLGLRSLPQLTAADGQPAWSPDGSRLVFRGRRGSNHDLYLVRVDGSGLRRLTYDPARDSNPAWTGARGGWIAFTRGRDLFRIRPDGTGLRRLTWRGGTEPSWSPHAARIAFTRKGNIHVMRPDSRGLRRLTTRGGTSPVWSPDGKRMLFLRSREGLGRLYVMRSSGRAASPLIPQVPDYETFWAADWPEHFDWGRRP